PEDRLEPRVARLPVDCALAWRPHHEAALLAVEGEMNLALRQVEAFYLVRADPEECTVEERVARNGEPRKHALRYARSDAVRLLPERDHLIVVARARAADHDDADRARLRDGDHRNGHRLAPREGRLRFRGIDETVGASARELREHAVERGPVH